MANSELFISELKSGCCRQTIVAPHLANGRLESGEWRVEKGGGGHGFDLLLLDEKVVLLNLKSPFQKLLFLL